MRSPRRSAASRRVRRGAARHEQEREEARGQLEAMLRGVADAVTAQAPDGRLLFANDAAVETLGFDVARGAAERPDRRDPGPLRDPRRGRRARSRSRRCPAGARSRARRAPRRSSASGSGHRRGALGGHQGHPDPRRRRRGDDGDQRHRGHHRPQALGAGASASSSRSSEVLASRSTPTSCSTGWRGSRSRRWRTGVPSTSLSRGGGSSGWRSPTPTRTCAIGRSS